VRHAFLSYMSSSSVNSELQRLKEFCRQHNGEYILVHFAPDSNGVTAPTLSGTLRNELIHPNPDSPYTVSVVFPRAGTAYHQVMTSCDGTSPSGCYSPAGAPSADEERQMLHDLVTSAALAREKIEQNLVRAEEERLILLNRQNEAEEERLMLLNRQKAADDERAHASAHRQHLSAEADRASDERSQLLDEIRLSRVERAQLADRLAQLEARLSSPSPSQPVHQPPVPTSQPDVTTVLSEITNALRSLHAPNNGKRHDDLATYLNPYASSHGDNTCPLLPNYVSRTLTAAGFEPYTWLTANETQADRIRLALIEMAAIIEDPSSFTAWAVRTSSTFTPTEWCLYTTGSKQCAYEVAAAMKCHDRAVHSLLLFARLPTTDSSRLADYASGAIRVPGLPLLGSHNGATNGVKPAPHRSTASKQPSQGRNTSGQGANNRSKTTRIQGGGEPDLSGLNALVRA
jgi:hypothetical protein